MFKKTLLILVFISGLVQLYSNDKTTYQISVRETIIREKPSFLGEVITKLPYGYEVTVLDTYGAWSSILLPEDKIGWLHTASISSEKIELTRSSREIGNTSSSEVALAGKGFNKEVEEQYINQNSMDYSWIDYMETLEVDIESLIEFTNEEGLYLEGIW